MNEERKETEIPVGTETPVIPEKVERKGTYAAYYTSKEKEEEGAWVTLMDGSEWKLSRTSSKRAQEALRKAQQPFQNITQRADRRGGQVPTEIQDQININWIMNGIVQEWKGVTDREGKEVPCSKENKAKVRQILMDIPDMQVDLILEAAKAAHYQEEQDENNLGN